MPARNACNNSGAEERKTCTPRPPRHSNIILDIYTDNTGLFKTIVGVLTTYHTQYTWDIVAPMDQEILKVFFNDVRCAVVMHFFAWSAVY